LDEAVRQFRWQLLPKDQTPHFINEVIHTIICCFADHDTAEHELRQFVGEVEYAEDIYREPTVVIDQRYGPAIWELGKVILAQLRDLRVFDEVGELDYEYYSYELPDFPGTILKHIEG
jgi:hypothetical protein